MFNVNRPQSNIVDAEVDEVFLPLKMVIIDKLKNVDHLTYKYKDSEESIPSEWQVTSAEISVFSIPIWEIPYLFETYEAWQGIKGVSHNEYYGDGLLFRRAILKRYPQLENNKLSMIEWILFAEQLGHHFKYSEPYYELRRRRELSMGVSYHTAPEFTLDDYCLSREEK